MTANKALVQSKKELSVTEKPSSQDSVLLRMLDLAAQITRQEIQPGEARFWQETFQNERPEVLEWAFREFLKTAQFFPKPADIEELLITKRGVDAIPQYIPINWEETAKQQVGCEGIEQTWHELIKKLAGQTKMEGTK